MAFSCSYRGEGVLPEVSDIDVPCRTKALAVYTDAVSFVTASVSMLLRLSFTLRRSSSLSEPGRFENAFKSGAFAKR